MANTIYIGYYNSFSNDQIRNYTLSAKNKMDYIIKCVEKKDRVTVVSFSESRSNQQYKGIEEKISEKSKLILLPSKKTGNGIQRKKQRFFLRMEFIKYIWKNTNCNTEVIVYHSLGYMKTIQFLKKLKKFKLIMEVEEIYSDVLGEEKLRQQELEYFKIADGYIFPTKILNEKINELNKPYCIIHGTYNVERQQVKKFNDGRIHIVYAGTFDPRKGGVNTAIHLAEFLDDKYHVHILGFGKEKEVNDVKTKIVDINNHSKCILSYDGLKSGDEFNQFLQKCDIGLSTQNPKGEYNDTSFPSKILTYMANGLRVVSIDIPVVKTSDVSQNIYYYYKNDPKCIADTIINIDFEDKYDGRSIVGDLDKKVEEKLLKLL